MIYMAVIQQLAPGKYPDYAAAAKDLPPVYAKEKMNLVTSWHTVFGDMNQIWAVFSFADWTDYQNKVQAMARNKEYLAISAKLTSVTIKQDRVMLKANPWSPMK